MLVDLASAGGESSCHDGPRRGEEFDVAAQSVVRDCAMMGAIGGPVGGLLFGLASVMQSWAIPTALIVYIPFGLIVGIFAAGLAIAGYKISTKLKPELLRILCVGTGGGVGAAIPVFWVELQFNASIQWFDWAVVVVATVAFAIAAMLGFTTPANLESSKR